MFFETWLKLVTELLPFSQTIDFLDAVAVRMGWATQAEEAWANGNSPAEFVQEFLKTP